MNTVIKFLYIYFYMQVYQLRSQRAKQMIHFVFEDSAVFRIALCMLRCV